MNRLLLILSRIRKNIIAFAMVVLLRLLTYAGFVLAVAATPYVFMGEVGYIAYILPLYIADVAAGNLFTGVFYGLFEFRFISRMKESGELQKHMSHNEWGRFEKRFNELAAGMPARRRRLIMRYIWNHIIAACPVLAMIGLNLWPDKRGLVFAAVGVLLAVSLIMRLRLRGNKTDVEKQEQNDGEIRNIFEHIR